MPHLEAHTPRSLRRGLLLVLLVSRPLIMMTESRAKLISRS
jgi:hypothetical protein